MSWRALRCDSHTYLWSATSVDVDPTLPSPLGRCISYPQLMQLVLARESSAMVCDLSYVQVIINVCVFVFDA